MILCPTLKQHTETKMIILQYKPSDKNNYWITSMKQRSKSIKNTMLLCKGRKKQLYNNNQPTSCLLISTSVDLQSKVNPTANNFILANKKNLHNFFKDRLPQDKIIVGEKAPTFSPSRIFKLRRQQNQKQQTTKIKLHKSFDPEEEIFRTPSTKKMNRTFLLNQKSKEISVNSISQTSKNFKLQSVASTYQTPTSSSMVKRCQTVKKQAYISVFGDKLIEEKSRLLEIQSATNLTMYENNSAELRANKQKPRPKTNLNHSRLNEDKQKLGKLLEKIQGFASFVNPYRMKNTHIFESRRKNDQNPTINFEKDQLQKNQLVDWIKAISNDYKQKNLGFKMNRMKTLEDIQKMDPSYYMKMKMHKNGRLWIRNKALNGIKLDQAPNKHQNNLEDYFKISEYDSRKDDFLDQLLTITDRNNNTIDFDKEEKRTICPITQKNQPTKQKLVNFGKNLIKIAHVAKLYSIKCDKIYVSLWKKRKPYELQGSYAFYKYIKHNNVELVQNFIQKNQEYTYQIDHEHRTPLIYAVQNNSIDVVKYLIKIGINMDAATVKGHTALSYALMNINYQATECILRAGASPWSTQNYDLNSILNKCPNKFRIVVKNARRIHIARSLLRKFKSKDQFWQSYKNKIQGNQLITFS